MQSRGFLLPFVTCHKPYVSDFYVFVVGEYESTISLVLALPGTLPSGPERSWSGQCPINMGCLWELTAVGLLCEASEQLRISI